MRKLLHCLTLLLLVSVSPAHATVEAARFDLMGPKIDIRVTRNGVSLPIALVPNLQPGDKIWLHPDLPPTQSVHYLLIATFLRGTTNPPPDEWFTRIETWNKRVRAEGVTITVPAEAQQAILFLAPETGGDFGTLRSAVRGRPGVFVRASQDLNEAGFEQARIEKYLASMKLVPPSDPAALLDHSNLLARTLNLRPNQECFKRPLDQQFNCLTQSGSQTLLDDGHAASIVAALSTGSGSDFINAASYTGLAGGGTYSAYVGALVDLIRIMNSVHTAQYQYIPAIAFPESESLNLRLNTAPSFHNPKSVIVIGMPAIQTSALPPLRPADPGHISCLLDPSMVLPVDGAPLVFSTMFAHDLVLHLDVPATGNDPASTLDLPLVADAFHGGLAIAHPAPGRRGLPLSDAAAPAPAPVAAPAPVLAPVIKKQPPSPAGETAPPGQPITGTVKGMWGFDAFTGPTLPLQQVPGVGWRIVSSSGTIPDLIVGQPNHLHLISSGTACVQSISLEPEQTRLAWKLDEPATRQPPASIAVEPVDLTVNLQRAATPGSIHLAIRQFGATEAAEVGTKTFAEPARIDNVRLHVGDSFLTVGGESLHQVQSVTLKGVLFTPASSLVPDASAQADTAKGLQLQVKGDLKPPAVKPGEKLTASIHLQDGREIEVATWILPPRPAVTVLSRRVAAAASSPIQLSPGDDLPLGAQLIFFLKSKLPYPRAEQIEIANSDESLHTTLSVAAGSLILEDTHTVLATFDPLKTFGPSTFGAFRLRAVAADETHGEWLPLATIVRLPTLVALHCPANATLSCQLSGSDLYLIDSVSSDAAFTDPTTVPEDFIDPSLSIPHPPSGNFFVRLRDDPATAQQVTLPILPEARHAIEVTSSR